MKMKFFVVIDESYDEDIIRIYTILRVLRSEGPQSMTNVS